MTPTDGDGEAHAVATPGGAPTGRRRLGRRAALVALALAAVAVVTVVVVRGGGDDAATPAPSTTSTTRATTEPPPTTRRPTTTTTTTTAPAPVVEDGLTLAPPLPRPYAPSFLVADAIGPQVPLYSAPGVPVPSGRVLENPTFEDLAIVFLVRARQPGWLQAQIMSRPNSAMAWIRASDVTLRRVPHHIVIERGARRLTVYAGGTPILQTAVATGKDSSPTPLGTFFVDGIRPLSPPHRAYGTGQVSFSGYSEVYESFGGGVGQVAMHGTQNPALIGTPASNGCVRMTNGDIEKVMFMAPTGTPVEVVA